MLSGIKYKKKGDASGKGTSTASSQSNKSNLVRESWMTTPLESSSLIVQRKKREAEEASKKAGEERKKKELEAKEIRDRHKAKTSSSGGGLVGDGGSSWKRRALMRARERAKDEGKTEDAVVREVWGSKEVLMSMNSKMKKPKDDSLSWGRSRRGDDRGRRSYRRRDDDGKDSFGRDVGLRSDRFRDDRDRRRTERSKDRGRHRESYSGRDERRRPDRHRDRGSGERRRKGRYEDSRERKSINIRKESTTKSTAINKKEGVQAMLERARKHASKNEEEKKQAEERSAFLYGNRQSASNNEENTADAQKQESQITNTEMKAEAGEEEEIRETQEQLEARANKLAAKAMKAKLKRKTKLYEQLMAKAAALRKQASRAPKSKPKEAVEVLSQFDLSGKKIEMGIASEEKEKGQWASGPPKKRQKRPDSKIEDGKRIGFFDKDKEEVSLKTLVEQERLGTSNNYNKNWANHILKKGAKFQDMDTDEQFDMADVSMQAYESAANKKKGKDRDEMLRKQAISMNRRMKRILESCWYCIDSPKFLKHLVVCMGVKCYLTLPARQVVRDGHCLIVPREHIIATTQADEDVQEEIKYFRKFLVKMFAKQKQGCVFMETVISLEKQRHTVVECIPLPRDTFLDAPIFFKKAILESDEQWSVNKKLINTIEKGLWRSVPKNFPFFSVEFGDGGGFAHVIEDRDMFRQDWGKEILCGMLGEPAQIVLRAKRAPPHIEEDRVTRFKAMWRPFDWTRRLKGGDLYEKMQKKKKGGKIAESKK